MTTLVLLGTLLSCAEQPAPEVPIEVIPAGQEDTEPAEAPTEESEDVLSEPDTEYCDMLEECMNWMKLHSAMHLNSSIDCAALGRAVVGNDEPAGSCRSHTP